MFRRWIVNSSAMFPPAARAGALALAVLLSAANSGCETASSDLADAFRLNLPSPQQAAEWMFHPEAEKRRTGILLIANSSFGGEEPYLAVYREAVTDVDTMVRGVAASALGLHGTGEDALLVAPLLTGDSKMERWQAAEALQRLHNPAVAPDLIDVLLTDEDPDVRAAAAVALGQYAQTDVADALILALDDRSLLVNREARRALRTLTGEDFGLEPQPWRQWYAAADAPFAQQQTYYYPVYRRDHTMLEKLVPINRPAFEDPGLPAGVAEAPPPDEPETQG